MAPSTPWERERTERSIRAIQRYEQSGRSEWIQPVNFRTRPRVPLTLVLQVHSTALLPPAVRYSDFADPRPSLFRDLRHQRPA